MRWISALELCVIGVTLFVPAIGVAQGGGLRTTLGHLRNDCVDDSFAVVFEDGSSTYDGSRERGVEILARVANDAKSSRIQGWSFGVRQSSPRYS